MSCPLSSVFRLPILRFPHKLDHIAVGIFDAKHGEFRAEFAVGIDNGDAVDLQRRPGGAHAGRVKTQRHRRRIESGGGATVAPAFERERGVSGGQQNTRRDRPLLREPKHVGVEGQRAVKIGDIERENQETGNSKHCVL